MARVRFPSRSSSVTRIVARSACDRRPIATASGIPTELESVNRFAPNFETDASYVTAELRSVGQIDADLLPSFGAWVTHTSRSSSNWDASAEETSVDRVLASCLTHRRRPPE